jgi:hypothetical protein
MRITRSGPPETTICPCEPTASAYIDALGPDDSGGENVMVGCAGCDCDERERSQNLMVRSNEPDAIQPCSRLAQKA